MAKFMNPCALLAACCIFMSVYYAAAAPPLPRLSVRIYHWQSERFIRGTTSPEILLANGVNTDPFTEFYPYMRPNNKTAFESVNYIGQYLIMNGDGTLSLGSRKNKIWEFTQTLAGHSERHSYLKASVPSGATCYISFDIYGTPLASQCDPLSPVGIENAKLQINIA